jgi:sulfide:quinone oxidoreductase
MADPASTAFHVVIAGGGVAGLEAVLALRELIGDPVEVTLVTPEHDFVYRPMAVAEPFARGHAQRHGLAEIARDLGVRLVHDRLERVDDGIRTAITVGGETLTYDALVVAIGAASEPAFKRALTWTPESDAEIYGGLRQDIEQGYSKRVAFVVPDSVYWPLPAYELALMTAWNAQAMAQDDVECTVYTHERAPLEIFGPAASAALGKDLAEAGVRVHTGVHVREADDGRLVVEPGGHDLGGRVVALPRAVGNAVHGLPADERGFVPSDRFGRVPGTDAVWVAGDAAAFPVKQGGLAAQQADVVARAIAARAGADVEQKPFHPVLRGVLLTGRGRAWMRHDPADETDPGTAARRALFWPPTKIAGRYLSPYLAELDRAQAVGEAPRPSGQPVELDLDTPTPDDAQHASDWRAEHLQGV